MNDLVKQSLGEFGKHLAMRPQGRKVQEALDSTLRKLAPGSVLLVDFSGVEMMDYSFADEALGTLYSRMAAKEYPDRYIVLKVDDDDLGEALIENIEVALNRREVAALVLPVDKLDSAATQADGKPPWKIIGRLPEHLVDTLRAVMEKDQATVRDLVEALELESATACNNRIAKLYQLHLVRRTTAIVPEGGRQYCYSSII